MGEETYNSWFETILQENEKDEKGQLLWANSLTRKAHIYYLNLAPGETKHYTFFYDKHLFNPSMSYFVILDYNKDSQSGFLYSLPMFCNYFASDPTNIDVVKQQKDTTDDSPVFNLQGISQGSKPLRPGVYIRGGKKVIVR